MKKAFTIVKDFLDLYCVFQGEERNSFSVRRDPCQKGLTKDWRRQGRTRTDGRVVESEASEPTFSQHIPRCQQPKAGEKEKKLYRSQTLGRKKYLDP